MDDIVPADVSIIAANYNNGPYLADFINSIIESTLLPKELILIDDGSTDDSLEVISVYSYLKFLKIIRLEKNLGFANALNVGIKQATGRYVMRVDPDDIIHSSRIRLQYNYLEKNSSVHILGSNASYFDSSSNSILNDSNFPLGHAKIKRRYLNGEHGLLHGTVMGRSFLFKNYLYNQSTFPAEDYDIFARIVSDGFEFQNLPEVLLKVRVHVNSTSNSVKFTTIKKTFDLRDKIFKTSTSSPKVYFYFGHIFFYRRYLFDRNLIRKYFFLFLSGLCYPKKLLRRLKL